MEMEFYKIGEIDEDKLDVMIIGIEYNNELIFDKVKDVENWELPEVNKQADECPTEAAVKIITEEIGAVSFTLKPLEDYCVKKDGKETCGRLFYAKVERFDSSLDSEIELRYFQVHPEICEKLAEMKGVI